MVKLIWRPSVGTCLATEIHARSGATYGWRRIRAKLVDAYAALARPVAI